MKGPLVCLLWRERKVSFSFSFFLKKYRGGVASGRVRGWLAQMLPPQSAKWRERAVRIKPPARLRTVASPAKPSAGGLALSGPGQTWAQEKTSARAVSVLGVAEVA